MRGSLKSSFPRLARWIAQHRDVLRILRRPDACACPWGADVDNLTEDEEEVKDDDDDNDDNKNRSSPAAAADLAGFREIYRRRQTVPLSSLPPARLHPHKYYSNGAFSYYNGDSNGYGFVEGLPPSPLQMAGGRRRRITREGEECDEVEVDCEEVGVTYQLAATTEQNEVRKECACACLRSRRSRSSGGTQHTNIFGRTVNVTFLANPLACPEEMGPHMPIGDGRSLFPVLLTAVCAGCGLSVSSER